MTVAFADRTHPAVDCTGLNLIDSSVIHLGCPCLLSVFDVDEYKSVFDVDEYKPCFTIAVKNLVQAWKTSIDVVTSRKHLCTKSATS